MVVSVDTGPEVLLARIQASGDKIILMPYSPADISNYISV